MYAGTSGLDVEGIYDGLPIDGSTIYWENGVLKSVGGGGTADAVAWENITGKPSFVTVATSGSYNDLLNKPTLLSSFTNDVGYLTEHQDLSGYQTKITSTNKLAYSLISGTPTIPTSLKSPYALTFGSKTYDGSAAKTITASDLGALTAHQTIYNLTMQAGAFSAVTFDPNGATKTVNIPTTTSHISEGTNLYFTNARAVSALSSTLSGYLPLTGGTLTGKLTINTSSYGDQLEIYRNQSNGNSAIRFSNSEKVLGDIGICGSGGLYPYQPLFSDRTNTYQIYHSGNLTKLSQLTNDSGFITSSASITGNAASATKLATARTIWGQSFDGTGNISSVFRLITAAGDGAAYHKILKFPESPYGLITRIYDVGSVSLQVQRESNDSECFNLLLNPLGGNVGIGINSPSYKFHVNGSLNATTIYQNGSSLSSLLGNYLPLSGGTLTGQLNINGNSDTPLYLTSNTNNTWVGFKNSNGIVLGYLGVSYNNQPYFYYNNSSHTIYHSGNDGSGSGLDADTLDGVQAENFAYNGYYPTTTTNNYSLKSGLYATQNNVSGLPINKVGHQVLHMNYDSNSACQLFMAYSEDKVSYRRKTSNVWQKWKEIAFTTDNVASATKLQTARTIWGQSFDGTGNVNGNLNGVGTITRSNANAVDVDEYGNLKFKSTSTKPRLFHPITEC